VCFVIRSQFEELITPSDVSYRMCVCLTVRDLDTSAMRRPRLEMGCIQSKVYKFRTDTLCFGLKNCNITPFGMQSYVCS